MCLTPVHTGGMANVVAITNFDIVMAAGSVTYSPVWFSTGHWESDSLTEIHGPNPDGVVMISAPVIAQFFIQGHTTIDVSGNVFLEFVSGKGRPNEFAGYNMVFGIISDEPALECFNRLTKTMQKFF